MSTRQNTGFASRERPHLSHYTAQQIASISEGVDQTVDSFMWGENTGDRRNAYATNLMGVRTTYAQLDEEIERCARAMMGFGVRQGDYVSIALPNVKEVVVYIYACWRMGAIANLIDPRTNGQGIAERVRRTESKLLVTVNNVCVPKIDEILDELPCEKVIIVNVADSLKPFASVMATLGYVVLGHMGRKFARGRIGVEGGKYMWNRDFLQAYGYEGDILAKYEPDMPAAVMYTSGTSSDGVIKGVVHTHRSINAMYRTMQVILAPDPDRWYGNEIFGGFIPFFSAYGLFDGMTLCLNGNCEIKLQPLFAPKDFAKIILTDRPNIFLGVPRFYESLAYHPKLKKKNGKLSFIEMAITGGDKIAPASIELINSAFQRSGCNIGLRVGYGSSEFGGSVSFMPKYDIRKDGADFDWKAEGNVGYLLPNCNIIVIDPKTGEELPYGEDGEICVNSMSMMLGYHGMQEQTDEITFYGPDGTKYYRMGDKGHIDERGCIYFIDRYKRSMMRPDGHTVHPSPVENAIIRHPAVTNCAVAGVPQFEGKAGVIPTAFVQLLPGKAETEAEKRHVLKEIDKLCLQVLPERDRAIAYRVVDDLPYTPMGKVDFRELEARLFQPEEYVITDFAFFPELKKRREKKAE
ncbi:MAG: acyl--CoA ligase [Oscillospiraceae bacterium]|jgi:long-chain acyl-CoA synthetase|nr:acyl--CoA ligase [Oscillospiraceae bacterium]